MMSRTGRNRPNWLRRKFAKGNVMFTSNIVASTTCGFNAPANPYGRYAWEGPSGFANLPPLGNGILSAIAKIAPQRGIVNQAGNL